MQHSHLIIIRDPGDIYYIYVRYRYYTRYLGQYIVDQYILHMHVSYVTVQKYVHAAQGWIIRTPLMLQYMMPNQARIFLGVASETQKTQRRNKNNTIFFGEKFANDPCARFEFSHRRIKDIACCSYSTRAPPMVSGICHGFKD